MKTSTLQSLQKNLSRQITNIESVMKTEREMIEWYKCNNWHKDYFTYRYKRLEKFRKELSSLVKIQLSVKQEIAENVDKSREFISLDEFMALLKVADELPEHPWCGDDPRGEA